MRDAAMAAVLRRLAIEAGAAIMAVYADGDLGVEAKGDDSPVTRADLAADRVIVDGLRRAYPDIPVVTEERPETHSATGTHFLVDPLDGTREFIERRGDFTVNIALVENGVPTRGVVYAPAQGRMFYTDAAGRALEDTGDLSAEGTARPIGVTIPDNRSLRIVASKSHRDAATDAYIAQYATGDIRGAGSSLKFCLVATGEADLYPRLGRTMEWDTAAGQAVLMGAGGQVVRFDDHEPLLYGKPGFENPFFLAYAPGVRLAPPQR
jgi:3'(2'), 5'-bisphosphate nucleotidase